MPILNTSYSASSKTSLENIYKYISKDNTFFANKELEKIYNSIELIKKNPLIGVAGRVENTREFFIPSTPYFIIYQIKKDNLYIVNIIHSSMNY